MQINPKSRQTELVVQELPDGLLIYDLKISKAFCLNEISTLVYGLCDGHNSMTDIIKMLSRKLKAPVSEDFVWLALDGLRKENLLEEAQSYGSTFNRLSRRKVVKRIGLAAVTALPVVASLIAPAAIRAQSLTAPGQPVGTVKINSDPTPTNCATSPVASLNRFCRNGRGDDCTSGTALYSPGTCTDINQTTIEISCVCG